MSLGLIVTIIGSAYLVMLAVFYFLEWLYQRRQQIEYDKRNEQEIEDLHESF